MNFDNRYLQKMYTIVYTYLIKDNFEKHGIG